jgi:hypothetical protein
MSFLDRGGHTIHALVIGNVAGVEARLAAASLMNLAPASPASLLWSRMATA